MPVKAANKKTAPKKIQKPKISKTYTNMFLAYGAFWRRGFSEWAGTSSRSEFWFAQLVNSLLFIAWGILGCVVATLEYIATDTFGVMTGLMVVIALIYGFAAIIPGISMRVRRLHDIGLSAWWMLLYLLCEVPFLSVPVSVVMFVFTVLPTKVAGNPYHKFNRK